MSFAVHAQTPRRETDLSYVRKENERVRDKITVRSREAVDGVTGMH